MSGKKILWLLFIIPFMLTYMEHRANLAQAQNVYQGDELGKPPKLEARLKLYKHQYLLREPIWVKVQVTNIGSEPGKIGFVGFEGLRMQDANDTLYPCRLSIDRMGHRTINAGQTFEEHFNILSFYGAMEDSFHVRYYLPPQKYQIYYDLGDSVRSETGSFSVIEPEGDELKAMNLLKEAYDLQIQKKGEEFIGKLRQLVREYPNSHYCAYALLIAATNIEEWSELIDRFPDSGEAIRAIEYIDGACLSKNDDVGFKNAMQDIIRKHPNTDVAKEARDRLRGLK
jgi:hypothetical protein